MALDEHDREDLIREGTAMADRGECVIDNTVVVIGFRSRGQVSLFCGTDPVFQFNERNQWRRTFWMGRRFAAENGRMVELIRPDRGGKVTLTTVMVDDGTHDQITQSLTHWLNAIGQAIANDSVEFRIEGADCGSFRQRVEKWRAKLQTPIVIADSPNA